MLFNAIHLQSSQMSLPSILCISFIGGILLRRAYVRAKKNQKKIKIVIVVKFRKSRDSRILQQQQQQQQNPGTTEAWRVYNERVQQWNLYNQPRAVVDAAATSTPQSHSYFVQALV